jgi:NhaA family Na+:H+ antiporter
MSASAPPEAWEPLLRLARLASRPLERFLRIEAASGVVLLAAAALALGLANSAWAPHYTAILETPLGAHLGAHRFERPLAWWINDALMVLFFFVVGMEIRREIHHGELSEWRRALLPLLAALGGMIAPAAVYLTLAGGAATRAGWGVPTATDIAFAVGALTLLGDRVPAALRVLLLAMAVIDDLGAIVVIALFYSRGVTLAGLALALAGLGAIVALRSFGVRTKWLYVPPAAVLWAGIYAAGVHPTIAGVIVGFITPVRAWLGPAGFTETVRGELDRLRDPGERASAPGGFTAALQRVDDARREALSPSEGLIHALHPWVAFGIMPLFALANAGVSLRGVTLAGSHGRVALGAALGLLLGKPLGVLLACGLAVRLGVAELPRGLAWRHLAVLGVVAGVGFTMALFVAQLAFADPARLGAAKLGVLAGSALAMVAGLGLGRALLRPTRRADIAQSADEAESSTEL